LTETTYLALLVSTKLLEELAQLVLLDVLLAQVVYVINAQTQPIGRQELQLEHYVLTLASPTLV